MKRIIAIIIVACMLVALVGCDGDIADNGSESVTTGGVTTENDGANESEGTENDGANGSEGTENDGETGSEGTENDSENGSEGMDIFGDTLSIVRGHRYHNFSVHYLPGIVMYDDR